MSFNVSEECFTSFGGMNATIPFYVFFLVINFVVGLPANLCMIWSICDGTMEVLLAEIQHLSLAVCEVLYCLGLPTQLSFLIVCVWTDRSPPHQLYTLRQFQMGLMWIGRPIFQLFICLERYIAVVHPLIYIRWRRLRYEVAGLVASWSSFFLILFTRIFIPQGALDSLVWVFLTLCISIYCCFAVLFSLKRNPPGGREGRVETSGAKMKKRAFNIILVHLLCFMVNFLPSFSLNVFTNGSDNSSVRPFFEGLGIVCGLIHPILYIHRTEKLSWVREIYLFFSR